MPTIRDVAKVSGVSYPTVSHVLNRTRNVSLKTRKKVYDAVDQLGYIPNAVARGLSRRRMNTIGVVAAFHLQSLFDDHCHGPMIESALIAAQDFNQVGMLHFASSFPESVERLSLYCDGRSDGLVLVGQPTNSDIVSALKSRSFPFVCVTESQVGCDVPYVDVDQIGMAKTLANHVLELGHRRIAVLCGPARDFSVQQRKEGFQQAFAAWHVPEQSIKFVPGQYGADSGAQCVRDLLNVTPKDQWPTALLCMNDFIAHGALSVLSELGIECPRDISVAGIDDARDSAISNPPLTTMRLPLRAIGHKAVELLVSIIEGKPGVFPQINLPSQLIVRLSVARPGGRLLLAAEF